MNPADGKDSFGDGDSDGNGRSRVTSLSSKSDDIIGKTLISVDEDAIQLCCDDEKKVKTSSSQPPKLSPLQQEDKDAEMRNHSQFILNLTDNNRDAIEPESGNDDGALKSSTTTPSSAPPDRPQQQQPQSSQPGAHMIQGSTVVSRRRSIFEIDANSLDNIDLKSTQKLEEEISSSDDENNKNEGNINNNDMEHGNNNNNTASDGAVTAKVIDEDALEQEITKKIVSQATKAEVLPETPLYKKRIFWLFLLAILLIVAVVLGVTIAVTNNNKNDDEEDMQSSSSSSFPPTTESPTTVPTTAPTLSEDARDLLSFLEDSFPQNQAALSDTSSPQYQAFLWLLESSADDDDDNETDAVKLQRYALAVFYYALNGDEWIRNDGWLKAWEPCQRQLASGNEATFGIDCLGTENIQEIFLPSNNLQGRVPPEFQLIASEMKELDLSGNLIEGPLSDFIITDLAHIQLLNLQSNQITGSIPTTIGSIHFSHLNEINFSQNLIGGFLPSEIGNLHSLRSLNIENCFLSGTIPSFVGQLTALEYWNSRDVEFEGSLPESMSNMSALKHLEMTGAYSMTGTIPDGMYAQLTKLTTLKVTRLGLHGTISSDIGQLTDLQSFEIAYQNFSGTLPSEIGFLTRLESFRINSNYLTGRVPSEFGQLESLKHASLHHNLLSGEIPTEIGSMNLISLMAVENLFNSTIPTHMGMMSNLDILHFGGNNLSGSIPTELEMLSSLKVCGFHDNELTGTIPAGIFESLPFLEMFGAGTRMEGTIPTTIGLAQRLRSFFFYSNPGVIGTIPTEIGALTNLKSLGLSDNNLTGMLPSQLANIEMVFLQRNMLTGPVPDQFELGWESIELAYFHGNNLTGSLDPLCNTVDADNVEFFADCDEVSCPCCTYCCSSSTGECTWTGIGQESPNGKEKIPDHVFIPRRPRAPGNVTRTDIGPFP